MQPVPGHGGASRGVCGLRGEQRHGCAEIVCVRDGEHGAPEAHPGLGDDLRVDPVVLGRPGKHLPGALHRLPGQISGIDPLRPAPAHDEGADAVLLVRDDQGGVACLPGQCADIVQTVLHAPADPDLAVGIQPDGPAEGLADIHAEIELNQPSCLRFMAAASSWVGWPPSLPGRHPHCPAARHAGRHIPISRFPCRAPSSGSNAPRAFSEAGQEGRPEEVRQRPREGPSIRLGKSRTWHCWKPYSSERGPQGPSLTVMGGLRHLFQSFYGSLDSEGRMELGGGLCFAGVLQTHKQGMHRHASASLRKTATGRGDEFAQEDLKRMGDGSDSMAGTLSHRRIRHVPLWSA